MKILSLYSKLLSLSNQKLIKMELRKFKYKNSQQKNEYLKKSI